MKHLIYILGLTLLFSACSSEEKETKEETEDKPEESGGPCEYIDMPGKINTIEFYETLGIIKGRFSPQDVEHAKMMKSSYTNDTILYYAQEGDRTIRGTGIRATMKVMVSGSCQPYPYHFKAGDGSTRLLVNTDSLKNITTDLKDEYK